MTPPTKPGETHQDPIGELHEKLDRVLVILEGTHDENGDHHPGLSHRVKRLENIVKWAAGVVTVSIGGLALAWTNFLAGPRPPAPPH